LGHKKLYKEIDEKSNRAQALSLRKDTFLPFAMGSGLVTWKCTFLAF
jgi:hypothetical protein